MTEHERMVSGLWYNSARDTERELATLYLSANELAARFNALPLTAREERRAILEQLLGSIGEYCTVLPPLYVDYGKHITIGAGTYINHDCYLMDCAPITIGKNVFIGPRFGAYTAQHPLIADERNAGWERALPITIGDNCWLGGNVTVLAGVTIGEGCVIGAGSVVTRDIPAGSLGMGVPCRVVRALTDADRLAPEDLA